MENFDNQGNYQQSEQQWTCPDCETVNTGKNCAVCGCLRPDEKQESEPVPTFVEQGSYKDALQEWICPYCETRNTGNVCTVCGQQVVENRVFLSKRVMIAILVGLLVVTIITSGIAVWLPYRDYRNACNLLESGQYENACQAFGAMGDYRDSAALLEQAAIQWADSSVEDGYYEEAIRALTYFPEGDKATERRMQVRIQWAEKLSMNKEYIRALSVLKPISQMEPIPAKMQEIQYDYAKYLLNEKQNYGAAYQEFVALGTYRDSELSAPEAAEKWIQQTLEYSNATQAALIRDTVKLSRSQGKALYQELYSRDIYDYPLSVDDLSVRRILLEMLSSGPYIDKEKLNTLFKELDVRRPETFVQEHRDILEDLWYMPVVQNIVRNDQCIKKWLLGTWRTENGGCYLKFYQNDSGGINSQYTLPWIPNPKGTKYYDIQNLTYVLMDENSNVLAEVYRFNLLEPDKIEVYAYKNEKTYTLVRK